MSIGREVLALDSYTRINLNGKYDGPQLSEKLRANITKFQTNYVPVRGQTYKLTHHDQLILNLKETLEKMYGANVLTHILPHYQRPDLILCFDENGKPVSDELVKCFPDQYIGRILSKDYLFERSDVLAGRINSYQLVAVILGGWNFYLRDTETPTGENSFSDLINTFYKNFFSQEDCE